MMRHVPVTSTRTPQPPRAESIGVSDTKGFHFIVTSSDLVSKDSKTLSDVRREHKRQVKSHVSRGRQGRAKGGRQLTSWVNKCASGRQHGLKDHSFAVETSPSQDLGGYFGDITVLPDHVSPLAIHDGMHFLRLAMMSMYPFSICESPIAAEASGWVNYMFSDDVYMQAMVFSTAAQADALAGRTRSPSTLIHASRALKALQARLNNADQASAISDPTIMAVVLLAGVAEWFDYGEHVENHLDGLQKMIALRGGLSVLPSTGDELWTKVCRVDLGLALRRGTRPVFFRKNISWDAYVPEGAFRRIAPTPPSPNLQGLLDSMDMKLRNVWLDLKSLSNMANLAHQSGRKIPTDYFAEIIESILYRLLHQSYPASTTQEMVRQSMLAFAAAISFQWHEPANFEQKQHTVRVFTQNLHDLFVSELTLPDEVVLWLLVTWTTLSHPRSAGAGEQDRQLESWLGQMLEDLNISCWTEAKAQLKSILWVDILHDKLGKTVAEQAMEKRRRSTLFPA